MATAEGYLRRLTRRLTEDPEQLDVEELSDEAVSTGAQKAIDCERGQEVTMVGTLRSVECNGKGCSGGVKAELFDGSDSVMLVWLGQRRIPLGQRADAVDDGLLDPRAHEQDLLAQPAQLLLVLAVGVLASHRHGVPFWWRAQPNRPVM